MVLPDCDTLGVWLAFRLGVADFGWLGAFVICEFVGC